MDDDALIAGPEREVGHPEAPEAQRDPGGPDSLGEVGDVVQCFEGRPESAGGMVGHERSLTSAPVPTSRPVSPRGDLRRRFARAKLGLQRGEFLVHLSVRPGLFQLLLDVIGLPADVL